jgi:hypothetical protein
MTDPHPRRLFWSFALVALVAPTVSAQTTQPWHPALFAQGSPDRLWIAHRESYRDDNGKSGYKTTLRARMVPGDWAELPTLYHDPEAVAQLQNDLVVLIEDGNWKRVRSVTSFETGPLVPGVGPVLGWGSSGNALYAVRAVEGGKDALPSTQPTTQPTSQPTTRPTKPTLMTYDRGQWTAIADLPPRIAGNAVSLAVVGDNPMLAFLDGQVIRVVAWADSKWQDWGQVQAGPSVGQFGLLAPPKAVAIWIVDRDGSMRLFLWGEPEGWAPAKAFVLPADVPPDAERTLTWAGEDLRLILQKDGKYWEQDYDLAGNPKGGKAELPTPAKYQAPPGLFVFQIIVVGGMVLVLLVTYYRRRAAANSGGNAEQE